MLVSTVRLYINASKPVFIADIIVLNSG